MKNKILLAIIIVCVCLMSSCETVAILAQVAGATGAIGQNTADAISVSARAIGTAAEQITPEQEYYIGRAVAANILGSYRIWT